MGVIVDMLPGCSYCGEALVFGDGCVPIVVEGCGCHLSAGDQETEGIGCETEGIGMYGTTMRLG